MAAGPEFMRPMRPSEEAAVDALLRATFATHAEAALVKTLRADGQIVAELVLPWGPDLAGYLALSKMTAPEGWLALAPVAIAPEWQAKGWGTRLVSAAMRLMAIKGQTTVVLGKPSFYSRCGFSTPRASGLVSPHPIANTLIARSGDDAPQDTLIYPSAFNGL